MLKPSCGAIAAILVLHIPAAFATPAAPEAPQAPQLLAERIDAVIAPYYRSDAPGATIIVVKDGKTMFRKAYGMADIARKQALTPDTALRIGSITKQFTSTAILMLAEEGKLSLGDDIAKYLPGYPAHGKTITIEHLLTHTSGIPSYTSKPGYMLEMARDVTVGAMIDSFKNDPLEFEPGAHYKYNNSGYFLLGAIIEKVSGQSYADFLQQRIFTPLGMTHTAYEGMEKTAFPHAVGYTPNPDGFLPSPRLSMTQPYAAGALVSSVDDLARWDAAVSSGKLLKSASWQRAFTSYKLTSGKATNYGYGWEIASLRGTPEIGHGGAITGFRAFALRLPADKVYVAVLSNADGGVTSPDGPAMKAAAIAIGKPFPEYREAAIEPRLLDAYGGLYAINEKANWTIRRAGDGLTLQAPNGPVVRLRAFSDTGFFEPGSANWVEFQRDGAGAVARMVLHKGDAESASIRVGALRERKAVAISHAAFDTRAGRYAFPQGLVIELTREGDRLFAQATNQPRLQIHALGENAFFSNEVDAELRFDDADPANGVVLDQGGMLLKGKKIQ
jgi:CubicO group peptidase (beta-lactamase class C family)